VLSIKELRELGSSLKLAAFRKQLGPFVLIQRPPGKTAGGTDLMGLPANVQGTFISKSQDHSAGMMSLLFEFEDLMVASIPPMEGNEELSVGRQPDCDLVLDDGSVSKRHAILKWDATSKQCTLQDLNSTNGTFLNSSSKVRGEVTLRDGDILSFGDVQFWYVLSETLHQRLRANSSGLPRGV
jgi:hypothetical protein